MTLALDIDPINGPRVAFQGWPKTPRLFRDCIITEKIDGTNAAVRIIALDELYDDEGIVLYDDPNLIDTVLVEGRPYGVWAQSRNRMICPGKQTDNQGFAAWVEVNAQTLVEDLGAGLHFGEWWGYKIARGYGLGEGDRRFSLFNVTRYEDVTFETPGVDTVPVLYRGTFGPNGINYALDGLVFNGSYAAPGYDRPEGIIVFHTASGQVFKVLLENDELPKSVVPRVVDGKVPA